jgi:bifunctional DNase/RNase
MVEMEIFGLTTSTRTTSAYALILVEVNGNRRLPIIIGSYEAQAIALEIEQIKPPRPMTHDLTMQVIKDMGGTIEHVYVHHLKEGTFYASVLVQGVTQSYDIDARPSDAIALAVRFGCPIYVSHEVLDEAGIIQPEEENEKGQVSKENKSTKESSEAIHKTPLEALEEQLQIAIETENYEKAAQLRDQLQRLRG